jgi:hypothetical protein
MLDCWETFDMQATNRVADVQQHEHKKSSMRKALPTQQRHSMIPSMP